MKELRRSGWRALWLLMLLSLLVLTGCDNTRPESSSPEAQISSEEPPVDPVPSEPEPVGPIDADEPDTAPVQPEPDDTHVSPITTDADNTAWVSPVEEGPAAALDPERPFAMPIPGDYHLYSYDPVNLTYSNMGYAGDTDISLVRQVVKLIGEIGAVGPKAATPATGPYAGGFMSVSADGKYTKVQYLLRGGLLEVGGTAYTLDEATYKELLRLSNEANQTFARGAEYLVYMNPTRIKQAVFFDKGQRSIAFEGNVSMAAHILRCIEVTGGKAVNKESGGKNGGPVAPMSLDEGFTAIYTFDNEVTYHLHVDGTTVRVQSSDMDYECVYEATAESLSDYMGLTIESVGPINIAPATGKPVIYLYPEAETEVSVKLDFDGTLAYTFPAYENGGWRVRAQPDGTLTDLRDGSEHYYLFWDGTARRTTWAFPTGYVVKGSEVTGFLRDILPQLGLTPREYNDFITYWAPELGANAYNLISFDTSQYEEVAKLTATPAPDTVIRVHMLYRAIEAPVAIAAPVLPATPVREGFTLVEWGGTRA